MTVAKDIHAGAVETAIIRAYWPGLVKEPIPQTAHCEPDISPTKVQPVCKLLVRMQRQHRVSGVRLKTPMKAKGVS